MGKNLDQARVLVIGGSSGIGFATALQAVSSGALVTIAGRSKTKLDAALIQLGPTVQAKILNTTDRFGVEGFFSDRIQWDHVVISAAQTESGSVRTLSIDAARAAMESKFWGAYHVARAAHIRAGGSLTFVSGFLSIRPSAGAVLQGAINAALEALVRGLALELAPIRVNAVSPGLTATPIWSKMDKEKRERMFANVAERLPVRRIGTPDDIANAVLYLMSTQFATGSTVLVDGGGAIA